MNRLSIQLGLWMGLMVLFSTGIWAGTLTDNGDSTVTDFKTGLVWQQQDDNTTRTWEAALSYCETLTHAGKTDWRLPNIRELESIVDADKYSPAIDETYFPNTNSSVYWSSTSYASNSSYAWYVHFYYGNVYHGYGKTGSYYARCVRGGAVS